MDSLTSYQYITCIDQLARTLFFSPAALQRTATPYKCDPRFKGIWKGSSRATPWSSAECRRRTRCHARGFARARTRARSCAPPRPALSPTGLARIPDRPPMRAGSDSMLGPTLGGTRIYVRAREYLMASTAAATRRARRSCPSRSQGFPPTTFGCEQLSLAKPVELLRSRFHI